MTLPKRFIEVSSALANKLADELECDNVDCDKGIILVGEPYWTGRCNTMRTISVPCPSCSPERTRLRALAKKWCWHEAHPRDPQYNYPIFAYKCKNCNELIHTGRECHPTFNNPVDIVAVMVELGVWEKLLDHLVASIWNALVECIYFEEGIDDDVWAYRQVYIILARVLLDPTLLLQACIAFMREEG